jgi:hypothetical protein
MWKTLVASGFVGAVGVVIAERVARLANLPAGPRAVLHLVLVVGVASGLNAMDARRRVERWIEPPAAQDAVAQNVLAIPAFADRVRGKTPQEIGALGRDLTAKGMPKLEDAQLVLRAKVLSQLLAKADEATCAKIAAGALDAADFLQLTKTLPEETQRSFLGMMKAAVEVELGLRPPASQASLSYADIEVAMTELMRTLPEGEQARFAAAMADLAVAQPAEACWASRRLYALIEAAPAATQATMARAVTMP